MEALVNRRPQFFITREKELQLIQQLETIVDTSNFDPQHTAVLMVSPDYSATVAMHLAHAWSRAGEMLKIIPVDVTYPDETDEKYRQKFRYEFELHYGKYHNLVLIEAGIIRGGNWGWLLEELYKFNYSRDQITLVALTENIHSKIKSDYVGEYYNDDTHDLTFYYEKFNKHWPVK
jgi:hypothetical protein